MFCTTLRERPSFAAAVPCISSASGLALRESRLETHDIALPLKAELDLKTGTTISTRQLRLLLLSPSVVANIALQHTVSRVHHFTALTGGQDVAIVFLLSSLTGARRVTAKGMAKDTPEGDTEGLYAYAKLQAELASHAELSCIPILPLSNLEGLLGLLQKHVGALSRTPIETKSSSPIDLLSFCTANPPMPPNTVLMLSDIFPSFEELAATCTSMTSAPVSSSPSERAAAASLMGFEASAHGLGSCDRQKRLKEVVGRQAAVDIFDFWVDEWIAE